MTHPRIIATLTRVAPVFVLTTALLALNAPLTLEASTNSVPVMAPEPSTLDALRPPTPSSHPGARFAQTVCTVCHIVPEPELITREVWKTFVLSKMSFYTGVNQLDPLRNEEADLYLASGLFRSTPMLSREEWKQVEDFYLSQAPADRLPHGPRPEISVGLSQFTLEKPRHRYNPPQNTMAFIDPQRHVIYSVDATQQALDILGPDGSLLSTIPLGNIPVWMDQNERGIYLACIGHFFPKEERRGQLILLEHTPQGLNRKVLFSALPRPCHIKLADLNADNRPDMLVSMFGYLTGRLSWYELLPDDEYREHILYPGAGALCCVVHDFNQDGSPDIAAIFGQELESLLLYYSDQKGGFLPPHRVYQKHPSTGHTYMEAADFNNDGRLDLLICNGDNGDYESPAKPYHGIRIYLNEDGRNFKEAFFFPHHGTFRALARDYDEDGDLDIAAVAFYPDYEKSPRESFVYLENTDGKFGFRASTFRECISGRWLAIDAGDLDGDGDLDLVLSSLTGMPSNAPPFVKDIWNTVGPSVLILKNTLR